MISDLYMVLYRDKAHPLGAERVVNTKKKVPEIKAQFESKGATVICIYKMVLQRM